MRVKKTEKSVVSAFMLVLIFAVFSIIFLQNFVFLASARMNQPKIYSISTINSKFTNGEFNVEYNTADVDEIILYYGTDINNMEMESKNDCECGRNRKCTFEPDLNDFENEVITYFFVLIDKNGNIAQSILKKVKVDTIAPVIENPDSMISSINKRIVIFDVQVDDENFDRVEYVNNFDSGKSSVLCRNSKSTSGCMTKKRFDKGDYDFIIKVFDKAGNSVSEDLSFSVL